MDAIGVNENMKELKARICSKEEMKVLKNKFKGQSIVYLLTNTINGKRYVGQTRKVLERLSEYNRVHITRSYSNEHLGRAMEKYGVYNFIMTVLEINPKSLDDREVYWIKKYKTQNPKFGYNKTPGGPNICNNLMVKLSFTSQKGKKVYQWNADGTLVKVWDCLKDVELNLGISVSAISHVAKNIGTDYMYSAGGFIWSYVNKFPKNGRVGHKIKKVKRLGKNSKEYSSSKEAAKLNKLHKSGITNCCLGKQKTCGGYSWEYIN